MLNPHNVIRIKHGSEGPEYDPYAVEEITFIGRNGRIRLHTGLATWCDTGTFRVHGEPGAVEAFTALSGLSPRLARQIHEMLPWRKHAARCPERRRFQCVEGYPGESFTVCGRCGDVVDSHFDISAVE